MTKTIAFAKTHKKWILAGVAALVAGAGALGYDLSFLQSLTLLLGL